MIGAADMETIPVEELPDGSIRYRSTRAATVTGLRVGMFAIRDEPERRVNDTYACCGESVLAAHYYIVDHLGTGCGAAGTRVRANAVIAADSLSLEGISRPTPEVLRWMCCQHKREDEGLPWQSIREWRREVAS